MAYTDQSFEAFAGISVAAIVPGMALATVVAYTLGGDAQGIRDAAFLGMTAGPVSILIDKAFKRSVSNKRLATIWAGLALTFGAVTSAVERPVLQSQTSAAALTK